MNGLDVHLGVGALVIVACGWWAVSAGGASSASEPFPPSVRDNPASYKPSTRSMTGWDAPYVPVGSTGGVYHGGGYSSGK
jgi:hypothetical protein